MSKPSPAAAIPAAPLLEVREVSVRFGGITALDRVSLTIAPGEIVGLIGPNGAGKTTLFNCLSRLYIPASGDIIFEGRSILDLPPHKIAEIGIGRTFQNAALFDSLSVLDNVLIGGHTRGGTGFLANALRLPMVRREERDLRDKAMAKIAFMGLGSHVDLPAGELPFPLKKRVELARGLMSEPRLLLLDEPAAGLNHDEIETLTVQIREIRDRERVTILLVEHHMNLVMSVSDTVVAVDFGRKIADGRPDAVRSNPGVIRAYLGGEDGYAA